MRHNPHPHADEAPAPRAPTIDEQLEGCSLFGRGPETAPADDPAQGRGILAGTGTPLTGVALAIQGIMASELHASKRWVDQAYHALLFCALRLPQPDFTSDDVWAVLERSGRDPLETERNPSALGSVFLRGQRQGFIVKEGSVRKSARPSQHNQEIRVWRRATRDEWLARQAGPSKEPLHA